MLDKVFSTRVPVSGRRLMPAALLASCFLLAPVASVRAQDPPLPPISIGAAVRTAFVHNDTEETDVDSTDRFLLDSVRLYVNGSVTTEGQVHVQHRVRRRQQPRQRARRGRPLRGVGQVQRLGRPHSSAERPRQSLRTVLRAPLGVFTDGVQDGYPFIARAATTASAYWGQFGKVKVSGGGFDGLSATGDDTLLGAGRVQVDFWDPEPATT